VAEETRTWPKSSSCWTWKYQVPSNKFQETEKNQVLRPFGPNFQTSINKMTAPGGELSERTFGFARDVRKAVNQLPKTLSAREDSKQLIRSSGSVAANYLEAQEGLSRKDFFYRLKVCRKEARESQLWLELLAEDGGETVSEELDRLIDEANQLTRIFSSIVKKQDESED